MKTNKMRLFYLAYILVLTTPAEAAVPSEGAAKADQAPSPTTSVPRNSGEASIEPAAAAAKALAEATAKGLHGAGGALLSAAAQEAYCSKAMRQYSSLLDSVRTQRVPKASEGDLPLDPDSALNRRYKSALYWLGAGFGLRVPSPGEAGGSEGEMQYFMKAEELKASQRAWLVFRDQHAKLFSALSPSVSEFQWLEWLTAARVEKLDEWMRSPVRVVSIETSSSDTPEVLQSIASLLSVMAFADTEKDMASQLHHARGTGAYNEFNAPASRLKKSCRGVKSNFLL